ncbi:glycoside hydrolase family 10 protein [Macroventuria anomochaeta]|uniref:Glycoside hydrolase family 10 protein n=1 Tax=Macroventuria anomochaeta TaxID=301207 RepID=A0ACB6S4H5_9PLEO|nr:glycoside hydrolase family 10 protein [Macroventuria anomochaeta]KAF2628877.1 glycoside hydrolase family 10 protein [Macroventuria anomochaeta]
MKVLPLLAAPLLASVSPLLAERQADRSVDTLFSGVGKIYFGAAAEKNKFSEGGDKIGAMMEKNFGQATNYRGTFTTEAADELVSWANANGKSVRGHTLVWGEDVPDWVQKINDKETMKTVIHDHVYGVVSRFKGRVRSWDVVNEIFELDKVGLKNTKFYQVLGEEYVGIAFRAAHKADSDAKLYINDYGLDNVTWAKSQPGSLVDKVKQWRSEGIPIDGIGSQTHLIAGASAAVETALRTLAKAALEVAITELDIEGRNPQGYIQAVAACYHVASCVGVTVWGVCDTANLGKTLFKNNCDPMDAYYAIADWLKML